MKIEDFLNARLDEDEDAAQDAAGWDLSGSVRDAGLWCRDGVNSVIDSSRRRVVHGDGQAPQDAHAEHIARHDPARVLREVAAKRAIIEHAADANGLDVQVDGEWGVGARDELADPYVGDLILRALAVVHSDHPDYRTEWTL